MEIAWNNFENKDNNVDISFDDNSVASNDLNINKNFNNTSDEDDKIDKELMSLCKEGDQKAFEKLINRHLKSVVNIISYMLSDYNDAEDLAYKTFIKVWNASPKYDPNKNNAKFTTWLYTIVRRLVFNETKRRNRQNLISLNSSTLLKTLAINKSNQPDNKAQYNELELALHDAIASLPEKQRMAIILWRFQNYTYKEISEVLNTSLSSVKSIIFRARNSLKQKLSKFIN